MFHVEPRVVVGWFHVEHRASGTPVPGGVTRHDRRHRPPSGRRVPAVSPGCPVAGAPQRNAIPRERRLHRSARGRSSPPRRYRLDLDLPSHAPERLTTPALEFSLPAPRRSRVATGSNTRLSRSGSASCGRTDRAERPPVLQSGTAGFHVKSPVPAGPAPWHPGSASTRSTRWALTRPPRVGRRPRSRRDDSRCGGTPPRSPPASDAPRIAHRPVPRRTVRAPRSVGTRHRSTASQATAVPSAGYEPPYRRARDDLEPSAVVRARPPHGRRRRGRAGGGPVHCVLGRGAGALSALGERVVLLRRAHRPRQLRYSSGEGDARRRHTAGRIPGPLRRDQRTGCRRHCDDGLSPGPGVPAHFRASGPRARRPGLAGEWPAPVLAGPSMTSTHGSRLGARGPQPRCVAQLRGSGCAVTGVTQRVVAAAGSPDQTAAQRAISRLRPATRARLIHVEQRRAVQARHGSASPGTASRDPSPEGRCFTGSGLARSRPGTIGFHVERARTVPIRHVALHLERPLAVTARDSRVSRGTASSAPAWHDGAADRPSRSQPGRGRVVPGQPERTRVCTGNSVAGLGEALLWFTRRASPGPGVTGRGVTRSRRTGHRVAGLGVPVVRADNSDREAARPWSCATLHERLAGHAAYTATWESRAVYGSGHRRGAQVRVRGHAVESGWTRQRADHDRGARMC